MRRLSLPFAVVLGVALAMGLQARSVAARGASSPTPQLAFISDRTGSPQIFTLGVGGPGLHQLTTTGGAKWSPTWSPDGKRIAFLSQTGLSRDYVNGGFSRISVIAARGGVAHVVGVMETYSSIAWSPDGKLLATSLQNEPDLTGGLFLVALKTGDLTRVTKSSPDEDLAGMPAWSPDGRQISYSAINSCCPSYAHIYTVGIDGRNHRQVTHNAVGQASSPAWSPGGRLIAFTFNHRVRHDPWHSQIEVVSPTGTDLRVLTRSDSVAFEPTWSPDGHWIAISSHEGLSGKAPTHLYLMSANGGQLTQLTRGQSSDYWPAWRPR